MSYWETLAALMEQCQRAHGVPHYQTFQGEKWELFAATNLLCGPDNERREHMEHCLFCREAVRETQERLKALKEPRP